MSEEEFQKLKADEAKTYADYSKAEDHARTLAQVWLPLRQKLDRENMRREIAKELGMQ